MAVFLCLCELASADSLWDLVSAPEPARVDTICTDEFLDQHEGKSWVWYLCALKGSDGLRARLRMRIPVDVQDRTLAAIVKLKTQGREEGKKLLDAVYNHDDQAITQWFKQRQGTEPGALLAFIKLAASQGDSLMAIKLLRHMTLSETEILEVLVASPDNYSATDNFLALKRYFEVQDLLPTGFNRKLLVIALDHAHLTILNYLEDRKVIHFNDSDVRPMMNAVRSSAAYQKRSLGFAHLGFGPLVLRLAVEHCETQTVRALLRFVSDSDAIVEEFRSALSSYRRDREKYADIVEAFIEAAISERSHDKPLQARLLACAVLETQMRIVARLILAGVDPSAPVAISRKEEPKSAVERALALQRATRENDQQRPSVDKIVGLISRSGSSAQSQDQCTERPRRAASLLSLRNRRAERYPPAAAAAAAAVVEAPRRSATPDVRSEREFPNLPH